MQRSPTQFVVTGKARAAGVTVEHVQEQGLWHDYPLQAGLVAAGDDAVERIARMLDDVWRRDA